MVSDIPSWPNDAGFDNDYEQHAPVQLAVKGVIPRFTEGVLYRTGPMGYKVKHENGVHSLNHWFDGLSCVHRFEIDFSNGESEPKVTYRSRRTVDEMMETIKKTGNLDGAYTFAAQRDPCNSYFAKLFSMFSGKDTKNVGVTLSINMPGGGAVGGAEKPAVNGHSNEIQTLHAKTDSSLLRKVDPVTLVPERATKQKRLHPELKGPLAASHAKTDPHTGDLFNYNLDMGYNSTYRIFTTSAATGETTVLATFPGKPAYIHSLFLTENYVILCVWNSYITWSGLSVLYHKNILDAISRFDPSQKTMWYVVDRKPGRGLVATYESEAFFCFHSVNAWEQPSPDDPKKTDIIAELSLYENTDVMHNLYYDNITSAKVPPEKYSREGRLSTLPNHTQFRLPQIEDAASSSQKLPAELLFKADKMISCELGTLNPKYLTRRHRYTYGVVNTLKSSFFDSISKFDNKTQTAKFWYTNAHTPGEPIFVADPNGTEEDDGVLLSVVLDGYKEKSYLLILDAKDLSEKGRAEMDGPMAFGFHGTYKAVGRKYGGDT